MRLALVTGAAGFLGRAIAEHLLAAGYRVRGLMRRPDEELTRQGVEPYLADLRDAERVAGACAGVEVVFHVAAVAGIWGPWRHYYEINTLGTEHVLAGCQQHGVPRLVFTSSPSVTFDGRDQCGVDESVPYPARWLCHYPHTKALAERAVLAANGRDALATCALRPHLIWGRRDPHLVPRLVERAKAGQLRRVGPGGNRIDIIHVDNAAVAHLQAAEALARGAAGAVGGKAYFISQGEPVDCWQWIDELLALHGLPPVRRSVSLRTAWLAGAVLEGAYRTLSLRGEPRMTRFLAAQLGRHHYFDISAARRDFGYSPRVSTAEGMRQLAEAAQAPTAG